jgi:hypothetical protein
LAQPDPAVRSEQWWINELLQEDNSNEPIKYKAVGYVDHEMFDWHKIIIKYQSINE